MLFPQHIIPLATLYEELQGELKSSKVCQFGSKAKLTHLFSCGFERKAPSLPTNSEELTNFDNMTHRENIINFLNRQQIMAETFGLSNIFATLSQVLTYNSLYIIKYRGRPRVNIRLFLHPCKFWSSERKGKLVCTLPSRDKTRLEVKGGQIVFFHDETKVFIP